MQAILIFSIYRQRNRWKLDSSVGTITKFVIVLSKYYFSTLFGSFLILVSIAGVMQNSIAWKAKGILSKRIKKSNL
jgi:hypothetical protein